MYEYSPTSRINIGDQGKDGETNAYEDRTSLDGLNPVADNIIKCVLCNFHHKNLVLLRGVILYTGLSYVLGKYDKF